MAVVVTNYNYFTHELHVIMLLHLFIYQNVVSVLIFCIM